MLNLLNRRQEERIREQEERLHEQEERLSGQEERIREQEERIHEQEKRLSGQEERIREQEERIHEQDERLWEQEWLPEQEGKRWLERREGGGGGKLEEAAGTGEAGRGKEESCRAGAAGAGGAGTGEVEEEQERLLEQVEKLEQRGAGGGERLEQVEAGAGGTGGSWRSCWTRGWEQELRELERMLELGWEALYEQQAEPHSSFEELNNENKSALQLEPQVKELKMLGELKDTVTSDPSKKGWEAGTSLWGREVPGQRQLQPASR
uniref:Golgin subfamily A conserved domain-containing protein n=1 Tax=Macaca fascicularis TaxID=9541 RepID=A0A7N9DA03_MACFA